MPKAYPRVLVISPCTFNYQNGGGTTFSNLFSGWPKEALANLHNSSQQEDSSVCGRFFRLGEAEIHKKRIFGWAPAATSVESTSSSETSGAFSWKHTVKQLAIGNSGWPATFKLSPHLEKWLEEFRPQIIYTILGSLPFLEAISQIQEKFHSKLVIHHMDDWYESAYTSGIFRKQRTKMLTQFHHLMKNADLRLTICDAMSETYHNRFGFPFESYQNAIDVERAESLMNEFPSTNANTLLYFGSVLPFSQENSLLEVIEQIQHLKKLGKPYKIRVVAPSTHLLQLKKKVEERNLGILEGEEISGDPDQFFRELSMAGALLLPSNFDSAAEEFLKYSMPTKIPGFLTSGKPILLYAPASLAQVKYAQKEEWGIVCSEHSENILREKIEEVFSDDVRRSSRQKNPMLARRNHDIKTVQKEFQEAIYSLVNNG
jgi:hypothetical protein